jgi:hypothetical protein
VKEAFGREKISELAGGFEEEPDAAFSLVNPDLMRLVVA